MKFENIWIPGAAIWVSGEIEYAADAVAANIMSSDAASLKDIKAVPVSTGVSAPDMAVNAANSALRDSGIEPTDVDYLVHAWLYYQGHDQWSPHYIASRLGATSCLPVSIRQGCEGSVLAAQQTALRLSADSGDKIGLVTAADRFNLPGIDRWNFVRTFALGDAGSAIILCSERNDAVVKVESICTRTSPDLEVLTRGGLSFCDYPLEQGMPLRETVVPVHLWSEKYNLRPEDIVETARTQLRGVFLDALSDAGLRGCDERLQIIVLPRAGNATANMTYMPIFSEFDAEILRWDKDTGHIACSDFGADIAHIVADDVLEEGRYAALIGAGAGFTWTCTVLSRAKSATS